MSNRYQTLDISLQTQNVRNDSRISQTIENGDYEQPDQQDNHQADERVKKFRELYYRNQKLRKQLKILNMKLNQRLDKIKLPNVKKRAVSVDLNYNPPNKALQRQLENAYKQVKMYKEQIQILKIKQESSQNYARLRDMENMISFRDKQIATVQQDLISAKNIKRMQDKKILSQLENQDVKERLEQYQRQHKQLKNKLKIISKKSRKREEEYKKQQAYLVSVEKKARQINQQERKDQQQNKIEPVRIPDRHITEAEFHQVKDEINTQKKINDDILVKIGVSKKWIEQSKRQQAERLIDLKEKDATLKILQTKLMAVNRLLRDQERRQREELPPPNKLIRNIQEAFNESDQGKQSQSDNGNQSLKKMLNDLEGVSGGEGFSKNLSNREWKGKYRKVEHGFGGPTDQKYQYQGKILGFNVCLDENESIVGLNFIVQGVKNQQTETPFLGLKTNIELKWIVPSGDEIVKISGSFTQQSYLNQIIVSSKNGKTGVFGAASSDPFMFILNDNQTFTSCFGSIRELGKDKRVTEFGFWVQKSE